MKLTEMRDHLTAAGRPPGGAARGAQQALGSPLHAPGVTVFVLQPLGSFLTTLEPSCKPLIKWKYSFLPKRKLEKLHSASLATTMVDFVINKG